MSMMVCPECKKEISNQADKCPNCGASPSLGKVGKYIAAALVVAIVIGLIADGDTPTDSSPQINTEEAERNHRANVARSFEKAIQSSLRDPESLKVEQMAIDSSGNVACAIYRAKNGFGGMNKGMAVKVGSSISEDADSWNKHCVGGSLYDMLWSVKNK